NSRACFFLLRSNGLPLIVTVGNLLINSCMALYNRTSCMAVRNRSWPFAAKISAMAFPKPLDAPVMTTFTDFRFLIVDCRLKKSRIPYKSKICNLQSEIKYHHLFFDLDHTLWDFQANAKATLKELHVSLQLEEKGIDDFDRFHQNYLVHNEMLWERYRNGYIKQEELRVKRMRLSLLDFKISDEELAQELSLRFLDLLPTRTILFP